MKILLCADVDGLGWLGDNGFRRRFGRGFSQRGGGFWRGWRGRSGRGRCGANLRRLLVEHRHAAQEEVDFFVVYANFAGDIEHRFRRFFRQPLQHFKQPAW